jgi:hypothetical protein
LCAILETSQGFLKSPFQHPLIGALGATVEPFLELGEPDSVLSLGLLQGDPQQRPRANVNFAQAGAAELGYAQDRGFV